MAPTIVTTLPAATEIVAALGCSPAGISHECDYPPAMTDAAVVTTTEGNGAYRLRKSVVESIDPDVVITQGTCDVCAIDSNQVRADLAETDCDPTIVETDVHRLADLYADIDRIGEAIGQHDAAVTLRKDLQARVEAIRSTPTPDTPQVAVLDWMDPIMIAGHWVPEMVEIIGAAYPLEGVGQSARPRKWETVRGTDPEIIVIGPCGYSLEQTTQGLTALIERAGWEELQAVRDNRVYMMDGSHYLNRPGPRLIDTLEYLAGIVYPDRFETPPTAVARPIET